MSVARPLRIEYEGAVYHVMNRGRGRSFTFHSEEYYQAFLQGVYEAHQRFGAECLAYCLMGNHYHLLLKTPRGNLSRIMRHIDGLYTQRYNRLKQTDGPLFRGRYKSILIDSNAYLLQVSRYIHRNPLELRKPLVDRLEQYHWSSYPAYLNRTSCPEWLYRGAVYDELSTSQRYAAYRRYVEAGNDIETEKFYSSGGTAAIWGDDRFKKRALSRTTVSRTETAKRQTRTVLDMKQIVWKVAEHYEVSEQAVTKARRGRGSRNYPRWIAMKLCQDFSGATLEDMAKVFHVGHYCTVSQTIGRLNKALEQNSSLRRALNTICQDLTL